ncbi:MAG: Leucine Rich repeats (2 copies) [Chloroflexi bacterium ADurb.Bin360]|nr:MAG: Leucine Rich repeats (2 copies) [Chloroflexi bacterium ADurb.Bin360]
MKKRTMWLNVVLLLALFLPGLGRPTEAAATFSCANVTEIPQIECEALVTLSDATGYYWWTNKTGWLTTNTPCSWFGVTCQAGRVSQLILNNNTLNLSYGFSNSIPPEIGNLERLETLSLSDNFLRGSIPPEIGQLVALKNLNLASNELQGSIPSTVGQLAGLEKLQLSNNQLSGLIPPEIGTLGALQVLDLSGNQLGGSVPSEIGQLPALQTLAFNNNSLSGAIPLAYAALTKLNYFAFYDTDCCVSLNEGMFTWLNQIPNLYGTGKICGISGGGLSGTVTSSDTTPAANINVFLYRSLGSSWRQLTATKTAVNGTYQFFDLGQGPGIDYRVQFADPTFQLAPQYYDNQLAIYKATPITVTVGAAQTGIDAALAPGSEFLAVFEAFLRPACGICQRAAPNIDRLAEDYADKPVVFLEYDVDHPVEIRYRRWWAAYNYGASACLPLTMVDSGYRYSYGNEDFYTVYKGMVDDALANPRQAEMIAYMRRNGDRMVFDITVTNRSGEPLGYQNYATVHALVYEEGGAAGMTQRFVRAGSYTEIMGLPLLDGETRHFSITTGPIGSVDWQKLHGVALVDSSQVGNYGPYQALQAVEVTAIDLLPNTMAFMAEPGESAAMLQPVQLSAPSHLTWQLSYDAGWLDIASDSGAMMQGPVIGVDPTHLAPGWQTAAVTLNLLDGVTVVVRHTIVVNAYLGVIFRAHLPIVSRP